MHGLPFWRDGDYPNPATLHQAGWSTTALISSGYVPNKKY